MSNTSLPTLCHECSQHMESPLCCTNCGALNLEGARDHDYFELFGLPRAYDLDTSGLHRKYLALARATHPDVTSGSGSETLRQNVLQINAELNEAYETLKDPVQRASYLLKLSGGPSAAEDKTVPGNVLGEVMMLREEVEEAESVDDRATLLAMRKQVESRQQATMDEIAQQCRELPSRGEEVFASLRHALNTIKYWNNLLEQLPADED